MSTSVDKLIETTQALLWERGYVGMSPRAIQDMAGVGQGSMYHHFRSKAALALAAEERTAAELIAAVDQLLSAPADGPLERLIAYLRLEQDILKGCRIGRLAADPDVIADETLRRPVEETLAWITSRIASLLQEAQVIGRLPTSLDVRAVASTIVAVRQGAYVLARSANSTRPYEQAVEGLIALIEGQASAADSDSTHVRKK
ncbi:TetR family transcriptional regulator [Burkholderia ubonensis]|uniref:TetR/AcrR family transcriptional regulator n=1 Tax=Burkholderia ubonensis TaxID=101571 RepID=UPI0007528E89|nr:TetR/AcrR family transcriptional regulator [Burkholderia ubonensis]KVD40504.1 TetR family transcriptional regulator [Burkholderia ubonensis]KVT95928.1 TetR family transcriptional regulator [Burkholderia ubonensis]KVU08806.1 TetR family transcriptional regulator [Burkholderia ubonensis]